MTINMTTLERRQAAAAARKQNLDIDAGPRIVAKNNLERQAKAEAPSPAPIAATPAKERKSALRNLLLALHSMELYGFLLGVIATLAVAQVVAGQSSHALATLCVGIAIYVCGVVD